MRKIASLLTIVFTFLILTSTISKADVGNFTILENTVMKVKAGTEADYMVKIKNIGSDTARRTEVEFNITNDPKATLEVIEPIKYIGLIGKSAIKEIPFKIKSTDIAKIGKYPVDLVITYYNLEGGKVSLTKKLTFEVIEEKKPPMINITSAQGTALAAGESGKLDFNVINYGEVDINSLKIEITNLDKETMYIEGNTNVIYIDRLLRGETKKLSYKIKIADDYTAQTLNANLKYNFKDTVQNDYNGEQTLYVDLNNAKSKRLEIQSINIDADEVEKNQVFNVSGVILNSGDIDISDVDITVEPDEGIIPISQSAYHENIIKPFQSKTYNFRLKAKDDANEKSYNIKFKVTYKKGSKEEVIYRYVGTYVKGKADSKKSVPKIILGEYKINPKIVRADSEFDLDIAFKNTHGSKYVKNIKAYITVDEKSNETGSVFSPVGGSNTFYIKDIRPGDAAKRSLKMYAIPDAKPKTYELIINIEYEDEEGNQLTGKEFIGIPVKQRTKIELSDITSYSEKFVGQDVYLSANVLNTGMTDVRNVKLSVVGDVEKRSPDQFFGSLTAGNSQNSELSIAPTKAGSVSVEVVLTYEDISGNVEEIRKPFTFEATEYVEQVMAGGDIGPDGIPFDGGKANGTKGFDFILWGSIIGGVLVVVIIIIIITIIRRRKKKKEIEMMLSE